MFSINVLFDKAIIKRKYIIKYVLIIIKYYFSNKYLFFIYNQTYKNYLFVNLTVHSAWDFKLFHNFWKLTTEVPDNTNNIVMF